ncbi:hypothetical protein TRFO_09266 [Tritrichomonas foetus]|uniref:Uncharacterized protein n=1 Tax=Tritrichomonas foetus TaxID=1144522 RepID=A0A1J4JGN4_9EUKA|nr:hypothetical protein TRFO_09266 [Tritrichomonas foetus]|eukprot:OHS97833.1 hypothetical protein TRFO_09266 [Tritrichomonas foetus]
MPILITYFLTYFQGQFIYLYFSTDLSGNIILLLIVIHIVYIFISCCANNATPIIRNYDITQPWFSHSKCDLKLNIILLILVFIHTFIEFLATNIASIIFANMSTILGIFLAVDLKIINHIFIINPIQLFLLHLSAHNSTLRQLLPMMHQKLFSTISSC